MSKLLAPRRSTTAKRAPYECGIVPARDTPERFPVRFYLVAMIFIVFDIEIIFLYPWAVIYRELGVFGLVEMLVFAVAVFVSRSSTSSATAPSTGARSTRPARQTPMVVGRAHHRARPSAASASRARRRTGRAEPREEVHA